MRAREGRRENAGNRNVEPSASQRRAQCMRFLRRNRKSNCFCFLEIFTRIAKFDMKWKRRRKNEKKKEKK